MSITNTIFALSMLVWLCYYAPAYAANIQNMTPANMVNRTASGHVNRGRLFPIRVSELGLQTFMGCISDVGGNISNVGYVVEDQRLYINKSLAEIFVNDVGQYTDCGSIIRGGCHTTAYITYVNVQLPGSKEISLATDDNTIIKSLLSSEPGRNNVKARGNGVNYRQHAKRAGAVYISYDAGGGQQGIECDINVGDCCSKKYHTGKITLWTSAKGVNYAAAWSHHGCNYKNRDDYRADAQVYHQYTNYELKGAGGYVLYSGAMSGYQMGNNYGDRASQRSCGEYDNVDFNV